MRAYHGKAFNPRDPMWRRSRKACLRCMVELYTSEASMKRIVDWPCPRHGAPSRLAEKVRW